MKSITTWRFEAGPNTYENFQRLDSETFRYTTNIPWDKDGTPPTYEELRAFVAERGERVCDCMETDAGGGPIHAPDCIVKRCQGL